ncbi:unnamed protein product [Ceratitis capitata]|uniref:(Mediterranean fruit fly) hypothetical protein n=1 Tax=Ceratitis capitata TaxID=7213 RepID=A0A811UMX5_CERCA|nr:unnamed protein product [Ceratitis capitata]
MDKWLDRDDASILMAEGGKTLQSCLGRGQNGFLAASAAIKRKVNAYMQEDVRVPASACGIRKRNLAHSITAEDVLTILLKADGSGWDPSTKDLKQETFYPLFRQNIEYRDFFHVRKPD